MANDAFGALGGLMKGLSSIIPQDDPAMKMAMSGLDVASLEKKIEAVYAEIGKKVWPSLKDDPAYADQALALAAAQKELEDAKIKLDSAKAAQAVKEAEEAVADEARQAEEATRTCTECGMLNEPGTKFCAECGAKLPGGPAYCGSCGAANPAGTKFCSQCGKAIV